jgi:hypothetical protein
MDLPDVAGREALIHPSFVDYPLGCRQQSFGFFAFKFAH